MGESLCSTCCTEDKARKGPDPDFYFFLTTNESVFSFFKRHLKNTRTHKDYYTEVPAHTTFSHHLLHACKISFNFLPQISLQFTGIPFFKTSYTNFTIRECVQHSLFFPTPVPQL